MSGMAGLGMIAGFTDIISKGIANEWEKEATEEQYQNQLGLSAHNARLALQNWKDTNFDEQRRQMERAGLSIGMMYGKGGGQGGVSVTPPGQIQKRNVHALDINSAIQAGLQAKQLELQEKQLTADVKNTDADTKLKEIEAGQKEGVDLETKQATLTNIKQQTENKAIEKEILTYEQEMKRIEQNIAQETERDIVYQAKANASKLMDEARSAYAKANIDQTTQETQIKMIEQNAKEQTLRMLVMKLSGDKLIMETEETAQKITKLTGEIDKLISETENVEARTANEKQKLILDKIANEFMYGDEAKAIRLIRAYKDTVQGLKLPGKNNLKSVPKIP